MARRVYESARPVEKKKPGSKKMIVILTASAFVLFAGAVTSGVLAWNYTREGQMTEQMWSSIQDIAVVEPITIDSDDDHPVESDAPRPEMTEVKSLSHDPIDREIDWQALYDINPDIKCWLYIPGTDIDYPVMQEKVLNEYFYLNHDIYGNELKSGSLLIPKEPDGYDDKDAHLLIFGHNMLNGSMFSSLRRYMTEDFYQQYKYIYLYYPDRTERWHVWTAYQTYQTDPIYDIPYEINTVAYDDLLKQIEIQKYYTTDVTDVNALSHILTLSTCDNFDGTHTGRFIVNAAIETTKNLESNETGE